MWKESFLVTLPGIVNKNTLLLHYYLSRSLHFSSHRSVRSETYKSARALLFIENSQATRHTRFPAVSCARMAINSWRQLGIRSHPARAEQPFSLGALSWSRDQLGIWRIAKFRLALTRFRKSGSCVKSVRTIFRPRTPTIGELAIGEWGPILLKRTSNSRLNRNQRTMVTARCVEHIGLNVHTFYK